MKIYYKTKSISIIEIEYFKGKIHQENVDSNHTAMANNITSIETVKHEDRHNISNKCQVNNGRQQTQMGFLRRS